MKIRIVYDVKENTDLTDQEIIANIPENLDPISTTDVKIRNYVIRYFIHKKEIIATYVKTLKTSKKRNLFLLFLKEQSSLLSDVDLYSLYRTYKDKAFSSLIDGNLKNYSIHKDYKDVLYEEILARCENEC